MISLSTRVLVSIESTYIHTYIYIYIYRYLKFGLKLFAK